MAERPLYTLYKNLKAQNYDVPDDYNKFESALTRDGKGGADNRHAIYENLKAQNFDVPSTYERFYSALFEPRSRTSSRAKGGSVPMTAADRARFSAGAAAISASAQQTMNNAGRYNRLRQRKQKHQKDFGRVNLGTHQTPYGGDANNVVKDDFAYNPETGKAGAYVTSDSETAYTQNDAEQKQNLLDKYGEEWNNAVDMGIVPSELDKADPDLSDTDISMRQMERRQEWLNENQNRRSKELNESMHLQGSPFVASGGAVAPSSFNTAISNEANRLSDVEYGAYNTAKAYNQMLRTTLLQELKEQKQRNENAGWWKDKWNDVSNYFGAMFNTMLDPKLYSQGIMDAAISNNLLQVKKGMEDGTIKKGSNAGNAAQAMLGAIQQQQGEAAKQQQYGTKAYQYGDMSGRSLKFWGDFLLSGWRNVMTTGFTKAGEKVGEKMALGALGKWFTKNTGRVLGDMAGSAALAATNQLGSTYNNVIERYVGMNNENGGVTQDKNGDLKFNEGVSLGKAIKDGFGSATIENFSEMFGEYLPGAPKLLSKLGLSKVSSFFEKIGNNAYYKWLSNATNKSGIQGVMAEISEEEFGTALHAAWGDGDGSWSDFNVFTNPDAREKQIDTCLGMFYSVGFMQSPRTAAGAINAVQYFNIKHQVAKADKFGQMMFNDKWDEIKSKIDVTTNADLTKTVLDATRSDSMTAKQKGAVINYAMFLSKLRGFNQASDAKTKDKVEEGDTAPTLSNDLDDAYTEGYNADDADKHNIQLEQNDKANDLAAMLHITPEQLHDMADEDLEAMTGQNDKLDQAIYDYQVSTAKYQGVMDGAQDEVDMAAHQAAMETDNMTDLSRGTVRKATIKATGGLEDYEVYIISGNIATHDDGSIDVGNSDDMIIYYDPTTGRKEHADAMMFADLIEELPAADVKAQAINDAKENAIKKIAGIIDGTVEVGSQFSVTDADGTEHTYEVLADNGDGTAMITIDGNVPTELVKGENVQIPYSLVDLQQMKDMEDQKRLEAAKTEREQMEKERAEQQNQETEQTEETQPSFDFNQILNDNGNVVLADVLGKDGNTKYPNSQLFLIRDSGAKAKVMELKSDGSLVPHAVSKKNVSVITSMSLDEYKQAMAESSMIEDNSGENRGEIEVETPTIEGETAAPAEETAAPESAETPATEQTPAAPAITLEDGTIVPMLDDGNPDFSKLTAAQTAELYDSQFGEDADSIVSGYVSDAKKALDKASNMTVKGKTFVEQKAAKDAKEKAIADAQAAYDSAIAIRDAYNERQLAKVEDTAEGRKELIEKARRKFARLKSAVKDDAEEVAQIYKETVGTLLHRLYDGTGIDVTDTIPLTAEEYVASNLGAHSLNYEGTETSKGVKQETGLSREDFAKTQLLAADGKGTTIDNLVHSLWENRPSNLDSLDTQDIRNAMLSIITSGFKASEARNYIENLRIAQAENILEEQKKAADNAAFAEENKAESEQQIETAPESEEKTGEENSDEENEKINEQTNENINAPEVPEDATDENPLGAQRDQTDLPFSARDNGTQQTTSERAADVEKNKVDDMKVVDNIVGQQTRKAFERLAKMMGANIQWQYSDKLGNGWIQETTDADGNAHRTIFITLDSSVTEGAQFIFGHEMTHQIKNLNPAAYNELTQLVLDTYGSDAFDKAVDETMKRYSDAGFSGRARDYYAEEVVADAVGEMIRDLNLAHTLAMKMSHPLLAAIHEILQKIKLAFFGTEYSDVTKNIIRSIEQAYVKTANGQVTNSETGEDVSFSLRQKPEPKKKGIGYKVFVLKDGKLYPPMVANPDGAATPVGVWLDADAAPIAGESKTGRPQVKQGGKGTQGGSGKLAYRPGWHLGVVPYAIQFNRKDAEGNKTLFPKNFVFAEVEYAADVDYQEEARQEGINPSGKYQHSLAGLKHLPTDGYYMYRTNPNPETDPWVITGAMKVNRILTRAEQADLVSKAGREPQQIQEGDIVTDDVVNSINQEIADAPKFSIKTYHGSQASFDKFDHSFMGSGEGAQAYGWGTYVSEVEGIAKAYAKQNTAKRNTEYTKAKNAYEIALADIDFHNNILDGFKKDIEYQKENIAQKKKMIDDISKYIENTDKDSEKYKDGIKTIEQMQKIIDRANKTIESTTSAMKDRQEMLDLSIKERDEAKAKLDSTEKPKRNLYSVDIPDDTGDNYLGWDEPLNAKQIGMWKNALLSAVPESDRAYYEEWADGMLENRKKENNPLTGKDAYYAIDSKYASKKTSMALSKAGFVGVKVIAQRNTGGNKEGKMNYVIFDENNAQITSHAKFSLKSKPVRFEAGKKLSDEEKKEVLSTLKDAYKVNGVPYHIEETAGGKEKRVYEPTADSYVMSDITNRPLRYYITLPDGRVAHPTEVYPNISDNEVKSSATKQGLLDEEVDQIVSAAIGNMKDIADNAKAVEVLTELQNLPHETHDVGYGLNHVRSYNYKTGIFTSDAAQAIDYVVRRMRRKEDVPAEIPAALKKAVANSYGMVDNLIDGMSSAKFSLKDINPVGKNQFGYVYDQFKGKPKEAFDFLLENKDGYLKGVFHRDEIGDIDLAYGSAPNPYKGKGLAHIIRKHVETLHDFPSVDDAINTITDVISNGIVKDGSIPNTYDIENGDYRVVVAADKNGNWVLTAFDYVNPTKKKKKGTATALPPSQSSDGAGAVAPNLSAAKIDNSSETTKENGEKFSLKDEKTLAGVHNITEEKLRKALKLGGFANPSLAVIDTNKSGHNNFGEISFIAPSALLDKRTGNTGGTWITDAYTQRYPSVEREMSEKGYRKFEDWVDSLDYPSGAKAEIERQAKDALSDNNAPAWELMYLKEKGIDIKEYDSRIDYRWKEIISDHPTAEDILNSMKTDPELNEKVTSLAKHAIIHPTWEKVSLEVRRKMYKETGVKASPINPQVRKQTKEIFERDYAPSLLNKNGTPKKSDVKKVVEQMVKEHNDTKKYDFYLSKVKASNYVNKNGLYDDYIKWQENKLDEFGTKNRIFRGYTKDGSRKYVPETLENVSKVMREEADGQTNGSEYTSFGSFIAKLASRVDSTDEMRANKDKLSSNKDKEEFYEKWNEVYYELAKFLYNDVFYGEQRLHDIVLQSDPKKYAKKEYGITLTPTFMKKLDALKNAVQTELKSAYFETKYNRPLRLNEFAAAVVPDNLGDDVRKGIENAGLPMYDYDPNKEGDRSRAFNEAINSSDNIRFSLAGERGAAAADKAEERTFRMDNLSVARKMEEEKKDAKAIKMATGWERGADGKWRYEMSDAKIKDTMDVGGGHIVKRYEDDMLWNGGKLSKAIDAPELFKAYPQLKDVRIDTDAIMNDMPSNGEYNSKTNTITIHADELKYMNGILNHEIQHAIQDIEGFAKGGSPRLVRGEVKKKLNEVTKQIRQLRAEGKEDEAKALIEKNRGLYNAYQKNDDYNSYKSLAGEVEARNVSARLNMTPEERRKSLAESTEDVARKDQIFLGVGDVSFSLRDMADGKESGAVYMAEDLKSLNTPDEVDDAIKTAIDDMPSGWKMANKKMIHIAQALGENRKAEIAGEVPKFSLKDGTLIKAGTYFSGGGLVEEGLKGIIDPVLAVEYDEKISGVYRNNFGQHIVTADVRDVDPRELVKQIDGEVEYFHASPVCKNYSQAKSNHAEVELDKETAASTAEFINAIKPKVVTIENVKGYKDSEAMKTITDALDANGYTWDADVYNAADYGGYTNRERLIVRAVRDGKLPEKPKKMAHKSGWYEAVADIIPTLTEKKNGVAPWMDIRLKADGIDWRNIDKPLYVMGSAYADGKVPHAFADELLPTLRTKSGDVIVMPDGKVYRAMGRVLARVSGVSDDYKMPFSENLSHTIIGNGIPTQLTEHVIAPLLQNTLRPTTPEDGNTKFSLRYDQFEHDLNQWKKDNNLPKDAQRPTIPQRNAGESAVDFLRRVDEYRKQMALWKTAPTYEQHLLSDDTALGEFNRELQKGSVLKRIAFQDSMLAIRKAQEAIMKEVGVDRLNMAEDAYTAENRSHGKGKNEFEEYNNEFLQPLRKAYHQMRKVLGDSYDNVRIYMMAKHGLERDAQMAFKKSLDADFEDVAQRSAAYRAYKGDMNRITNDSDLEFGRVDFTTWRQRDNALRTKYSPSYMDYRYDKNGIAYDYSGLSALFGGSDFEEAAHKLVRDIESSHVAEVQDLWNATNAATKKILRDGYKAGMMSKDTYQYVRDMYSHYIPLRGWDGTTADQVWDYIGGGKGAFNQTLKKAHGRTSIADDPIAYIENMAESGILLNNKNWVKQHLMLLAQNHPTSLLTLSKAWYVKSVDDNGNEEWIPATPQITSQMNSNQVKAAIDAFEQKMEQMAQTGDATQQRDGLNIAYPQTHSEEREHEVRVMKDGEEYVIYVNGDPQLAQAMNNTRAHRVREIQSGKLDRAAAWLGRKMAAAYTSLSPLFIPSNYFRDLTMTLASTAIREDGRYNYLLRKNLATSWNLGFMLKDYQNGKLREKVRNGNATPKEQMFYDFMMNGGETGFVSSLDVEDLKKKFKNDLKDLDRWKTNPVKVGHTIMDSIEFLNRMIEDSNRFAVYMTSIQYGRSIDEAVNDAKDVTLNFNRKGTGEYGWQMIRNLYLFINPAVQSLQTLGALGKHHPFKFTAVTASWLASGVLVPIVNAALMSLCDVIASAFGGDDDKEKYISMKDKYWQFTKWDRRNNLIMYFTFSHEFVKIPLAQEFRAFYGVGDMIASKMMGGELAEESWSQYAEDLLGQVVDMLPLDPTGYDGNIAVSLMPNAIRPVFELAFNVDFTGKPLFKETEYNKYDPNFTKAYVGTPDWLVRASKMVNSIGNDYPDVQQNSIDAFGDPRYNLNNPAVVDHVLSSYLGGAYTMGSQVLGVLTKSLNDPKEIKMADIPLFSKFVSNPDDRPVTKKQGDEFWDMKENHDRAANTLSKLKKQAKVDGDYSMLERFYGSEEYKQYKQDDVKVKKYEEDKKKERAEESGEEYRPHKLNAEDIYKAHATPKDDFEDLKLKQLYTKLNGFKSAYDLLVDTAPSQSDGYYNTNKAAIDAIDEISLDKQEISELKKGFLDDGKDAYNAEDMKQIRELRKKILSVLEKANKVVVANQKAKAEK